MKFVSFILSHFHFSFILGKWSLIHICLLWCLITLPILIFIFYNTDEIEAEKRKHLQHQFNNIIHESLSKPSFEAITHKVLYVDSILHLTCISLIWYTIASLLYICFHLFIFCVCSKMMIISVYKRLNVKKYDMFWRLLMYY